MGEDSIFLKLVHKGQIRNTYASVFLKMEI